MNRKIEDISYKGDLRYFIEMKMELVDVTTGSNPLHEDDEHGTRKEKNLLNGDNGDGEVKDPNEKDWPPVYTRLLAVIASLNSCNIGYDLGVNTGLVESFQRCDGNSVCMTDFQVEVYMGALAFTSVFGGLAMFTVSAPYGRRGVFYVSQALLLVGLFVTIVSNTYEVLVLGRLIAGFAIGLSFTVDGLYIAEVSPKKCRGLLVSWSETACNIGILLGFCMSYALKDVPGNAQWKTMIGLGMILPVVLLVLVRYVMPESPRWLMMNGRKEEAGVILRNCSYSPYDNELAEKLADELDADIKEELAASAGTSWYSMFSDPITVKKLRAGIGVAVAGALTGIDGVQYYMFHIFEDSGMESDTEKFQGLILVGLVKLLVISIGGYGFDVFGRKPMLILSNLGISLSFIIMAANSVHGSGAVGLFAVVFYAASFSAGMGPGAWLVPSELYSNDIRSKAVSLTSFINRTIAFVVAISFLSMLNGMSYGVYILFAIITSCSAMYIYVMLPESRGKTLEEMHEVFKNF